MTCAHIITSKRSDRYMRPCGAPAKVERADGVTVCYKHTERELLRMSRFWAVRKKATP